MGLNLVFKILVSKNYFGPAKGFHVHFSRTFWKCGAKVWRGAFAKYPIGGAKVKGLIYYGGAHLGKNPFQYSSIYNQAANPYFDVSMLMEKSKIS